MSRHRWRESLQGLREKHINPETDEQLKLSKIEIQNNVSKALKLVNDRPKNRKNRNGEGNSRKDSELFQLIEDFGRQYQSLYDLHVNLRKELEQTCIEITEEGFFTASSDSSDEETSEDNDQHARSLQHESRAQEVVDLKQKFTIAAEEREALKSKHMEALSKIEELERIVLLLEDESKQLKEKLGDKEGSISELAGDPETRNKDALILIKDLEVQVESLNHENTQLKEQAENESEAIKQLRMKESDLEALMLSLKKAMEEKEDELSALRPRLKGLESELNGLEGKMRELDEQLSSKDQENSCFKDEMDSLLGKVTMLENMVKEYENQFPDMKGDLTDDDNSAQIGEQTLEINRLSSDKELLQERISELEKQLGDREDQSNMSIHIEALTREVNQLQQEVDVKRNEEIKMLIEDRESLERKVLHLEITLTQREDKIGRLKRKLLLLESEASTRTGLVTTQMNSLQQQMTLEREKSLQTLSVLENQNAELKTKTLDQQMILKQQEVTINSLRADCKLAKSRLQQAADRKMEEMAEEFRKSFEANIRILRQRIRVAEQIQTENKEICKIVKERCEQDHLGLEKKVQEYSEMIASSKGEIISFFNATNEMVDGLQSVFNKFEDNEGDFSGRISGVLDEITVIKSLAKVTANEMKPVNDECATRVNVTSDVDGEGSNEKLLQVETMINKEDRARLMRGMYELQKKVSQLEQAGAEKEETILKLAEEKKEAIRQLCMSVEYHQTRCDQLIKFHGKRRGRS